MPNRFSRAERLKRSQHIDTLFSKGKAFSVSPIRIQFLAHPAPEAAFPAQAGFSVPKRAFRHAADRNLLKRRMRESWRLRKPALVSPQGSQWHLMLVYTARTASDFHTIDAAIGQGIAFLNRKAGG